MFSILIVEDEPVVRIGLRALIESETKDFHVIGEAEDGEEALAFARRYAPDLIITDIRMPVMDGLALMESLRREGITAAVFVVSGYGEFEYAQQALRAGAADFLLKPVHADSLTKALDRLRDKLQMEKTIIVHDSKEQLWSFKARAEQLADDLWNLREAAVDNELEALRLEWDAGGPPAAIERKLAGYIALMEGELRIKGGPRFSFENGMPKGGHAHFESFRELMLGMKELIRSFRNWGYGKLAQAAIDYLDAHYGDPEMSLTKVADHFEMSSANFSHVFKSELRIPFSHYLTRLRMGKAMQQISETSTKVYEIGEAVGFPDYAHFSKMFKKHTGFTPTEYRRKMRN
ncbi:hypothetical protein BK127_39305 [Paenibacillus sp. FSL H7-0331]|nr:hypothetical protein BK127_39305 [Paenibacillus sp. FSL H7-0331]